jgi:hypothetical protein
MKQDSGSGGLEQFETTVSSRVARGFLGNNDSESRTRVEKADQDDIAGVWSRLQPEEATNYAHEVATLSHDKWRN